MTEQKLQFSRRFLVLGNLGLIAWVLLAFLSVFFYNQLYGWLYLLVLTGFIYAVLRRLGCSSCYNCKSCTSGFGRLAGVFFGTGFTKKESVGNRLGFVVIAYLLLLVLPCVISGFILLYAFSLATTLVLICLLVMGLYSLATWWKKYFAKR